MKLRNIILLLCAVLVGTVLRSQNFRYTLFDGGVTPFGKVNRTMEDHKGFVWIASDNGLFRFDGQRFEDFSLSLESRHIQSMFSKDSDTIFFSNDSDIFKLYYEEDQVAVVSHLPIGEGTEIGYINEVFIDSKKQLWASSPNGTIVKIAAADGKLNTYNLPKEEVTGHIFLGEDGQQNLWALYSGKGLFRFDHDRDAFVSIPGFEDTRHFYVGENYLYLVGPRILKVAITSNNVLEKHSDISTTGLVFDHITRDLNGTYFLASGEYLFTLFDHEGKLHKVFGANDPHRVEELPFKSIKSISFSSDQLRKGGKIWVSTQNGLGLLHTPYFKNVDGMPHDNVFSITAGVHQKVAISQGNVFEVTPRSKNKVFHTLSNIGRVTAIGLYGNKSYYGTADAEIVVFQELKKQRSYDLSERGGGIFFMSADTEGDIWFCQAPAGKPLQGVGKLSANGEFQFYDTEEGLDTRILVIREGGRSEVYAAGIGIESYLFKYNRETDVFEPKSLPLPPEVSTNFEVHDLSVDSLGVVWMGTTDGLFKYDTETVKRVDLGPFTTNEIRAVQTLENGGVWVATDTDGLIYRYPSGDYVQFDEESGTPSKIASYRCLSLEKDGTLWVGTAEGAVHSSLATPEPLATHTPRITGIAINNRPVQLPKPSLSTNAKIQLDLATISYPAKGVRYQYKLVDHAFSEEASEHVHWSDSFSEPIVRLQNLSPGEYVFLVRAKRPGGYGWSVPVSIPITIKKPWYTTWWGVGVLLITSLFVLWYGIYQWGHSKAKTLSAELSQKQQHLEDKQAQLTAKSNALLLKEEELKSSRTNLYMLNRLLDQLPRNQSWEHVFPVLKKLIQLPNSLDRFEIGIIKANEIHYRGYTRKNQELFERKEEFNEKENLQSYALCGNIPLLIGDFETEVTQYLEKKAFKGHSSMLLVPFKPSANVDAIFCAYAKEKKRFSRRDLDLIQVLTKFLSITVKDKPI